MTRYALARRVTTEAELRRVDRFPERARECEAAVAEKVEEELQFVAGIMRDHGPKGMRLLLEIHAYRDITDAEFARVVGALPS